MQAQIIGQFSSLNDTDAGRQAAEEYVGCILRGESQIEAEIVANNVLQRAGFTVNRTGGASWELASIEHNEVPGARVSLTIDRDARGWYVAADGDDTDGRFQSVESAYQSIYDRWSGQAWGLALVGGA